MSNMNANDRNLEKALVQEIRAKYPGFPKNNQSMANALAKILGINRSYVENADAYMIWLMVGIATYDDLESFEQQYLWKRVFEYVVQERGGPRGKFAGAIVKRISIIRNQQKYPSKIAPRAYWLYSDSEIKSSLEGCEIYERVSSKVKLLTILSSGVFAAKIEIEKQYKKSLMKPDSLSDISKKLVKYSRFASKLGIIPKLKMAKKSLRGNIIFGISLYLLEEEIKLRCAQLKKEDSLRSNKWS